MGANVIQVLQNEVGNELAARIKGALDADAREAEKTLQEKDNAIASLQSEINGLAGQIEQLKKLEGANYDLHKQLQVKTAENDILRQRIAEYQSGNLTPQAESALSRFPDASSTGVPKGTVLTDYTGPMTIDQAGTVIDGKRITDTMDIRADNVVVKNSELTFTGTHGFMVYGKNCTIQDCTIAGPGTKGEPNSSIWGAGTFLRNNCSQTENGIVIEGNDFVVKDNYIHDLDGKPDGHHDGIACHGNAANGLIEGNTVIAKINAAVYITNDFGPIENVKVRGNLMKRQPGSNYSYTVYSDGAKANGGVISGIEFTDNVMEMGVYGFKSFSENTPVWSGNTDLNGHPI